MNKSLKVNVNEISLENINDDKKVAIKKEVEALNSIDSLFILVIVLVLIMTIVRNVIDIIHYSMLMIVISLLCIITIIYIRYFRMKKKKVLKELLLQISIFNGKQPIKVINYHETAHAIAMYVLLISLVFSLINSTLDILIK
ncbi:hypothetical protein [Staphylococcus aureus]